MKKQLARVATTDYFGQIPPEQGHLLKTATCFLRPTVNQGENWACRRHVPLSVAGSYDAANNVLSIILFDVDSKATYLNQEWTPDKDPLVGDAVNAYNDGPLADGSQMGPFYEMESVSPGAFLKPGEKLTPSALYFSFYRR